MKTIDIEFLSEDGLKLKGTLRLPDGPVTGLAVVIAGSGPTDRDGNSSFGGLTTFSNVNLYRDIAEFGAQNGMAVFTYDKRAVPHYVAQWKDKIEGLDKTAAAERLSELFSFDKTISDAKQAIAAAAKEAPGVPLTLIGHSEGGLVALTLAEEEKAEKLVLLATAGRSYRTLISEQIAASAKRQGLADEVVEQLGVHVTAAMDAIASGVPLPADMPKGFSLLFNDASRDYFRQILDADPLALAEKTKAKVLIMNGTHDLQVNHARDAEALLQAFSSRKTPGHSEALVKIAGGSHFFKETDSPDDMQKGYAGPAATGFFEALKEFLAPQNPQAPSQRKTPAPKP